MELERLEVILDVNTERFQESMKKVMPQINGMLGRIEQATGRSKKTVETNMDMSSMTRDLERTMNEFTNKFSKQMDRMEEISKKKVTSTGRNFEQGFKKTRTSAGKEIDLMVKDINAKMGQARAAQNRIAELTAQRASAVRSNDTGAEVKYDEQIANAEARMTSYRNKATEMARAMQAEFDAVPSSLDNISATMEANEVRIEAMRNRIADMQQQYESQRRVRGSFSEGFTTEDSPQSRDTMIKIQEQADKMNKLISSNDQLQQAYANTETRAQMLRQALGGLNNELTTSSIQTGNATQGIQTTAHSAESARSAWSRFGGVFNRTSNFIVHGARRSTSLTGNFFSRFNRGAQSATRNTNNMGKGTNFLSRTISQLGRRIFVYGILFRGIMALGKGMFSALKTNDQFASSLNQIQVNLLTAFYPIYQYILPVLNALMSALARVTGYFASFIATMFGTTYAAAKQGASGLYDNVKALEETGSGASKAKDKLKELRGSLMGFDEINQLDIQVGSDLDDPESGGGVGDGGIDFGGGATYETPEWLTNFADSVRDIMSRIFEPIKAAWDAYGQGVMDSFKYALTEVWELVKSIGRSFLEVWTDGTGERILGNILQIITSIFNSVGNLASGFREAWEANDVGVSIFSTILGIVEDLTGHLRDMGQATEEWTKSLDFTPLLTSVDTILKAFRPFADNVGAGLAWLYENVLLPYASWAIEDFIPVFFNTLASALGVVNAAIDALKPTFSWFWDSVLVPMAEWYGGALISVWETLAGILDRIGDFISNHQVGFSNFVLAFVTFSATLKLISGLSTLGTILGGAFTALQGIGGLSGVISMVGGAIKGVITILGGPWAVAIGLAVTAGVLLWRNWDTIKEKASQLGSWISTKWEGIKTATKTKWSEVKTSISENVSKSWENTKTNFNNIKTNISENVSTAWENTKKHFGNIKDNITGNSKDSNKTATKEFGNMEVQASSAFGGIWDTVKKAFPGLNKDITDNTSKASKNGSTKFRELKENIGKRTSESWSSVKSNFSDIQKWVTDKSDTARSKASTSFSTLKSNVGTHFGNIWSDTKDTWGNVATRVSTKAEEARISGVNAFSRMKSGVSDHLTAIQSKTSEVFDKVTGWASGLGGKIGSGLSGGLDAVKRGAASIANGIVGTIGKALNGVINGINWVLDKVGAGKSKLGTWTVPSYATGTDSHPGGLAMVNDAPGSRFREAYEVNGKVGLFPKQRNMLVNLPKGAKVLDGNRTEAMYGDVPRYAKGVGNWFSKVWDGAKNMAGTVWDYVTNPSKLLEAAISKFVNLSGTMQPQLDMAKGAISTVSSGATSFVKKFLEQGQEERMATGSGGGVNFRGLRQTSPFGYRVHPIYGTRRLHAGVDYGGGQGIGHPIHSQSGGTITQAGPSGSGYGTTVRIRQGIIEHLYAHLNRALASVGQNVKRGDLIGQMGSTGASTGPHVHYEVRKGGSPINPLGSYENGGMVSKEGYYRLAEGNKKELIIPLERRNRALELLEVAKGYLGVNAVTTLQMPETMLGTPNVSLSAPSSNRSVGSQLDGLQDILVSAFGTAIMETSSFTDSNGGDSEREVVLEIDGVRLGRAVLPRINQEANRLGYKPFLRTD